MDPHHNSQLLFIYPEDPSKSFFYPYKGEEDQNENLGTLQTAIEQEKKFYMEFTDTFGRELPKESKSQDFKPLQPFYITSIVYKFVKVHITLPSSNETVDFEVESEKTLKEVAEHIKQVKGIPVDDQLYFHGENTGKLDDSLSFIDLGLAKEHVDLRLRLKPIIHVDVDGEIFNFKFLLSDPVRYVSLNISYAKGISHDQIMLFKGDEELNLSKSIEESGIKDQDTITVRLKIEVKIHVMDRGLMIFAAPSSTFADLKTKIGVADRKTKKEISDIALYLCKDCYDLEFNEIFLQDDKLLCDYVSDTTCIELKIKFRPDVLDIMFTNPTVYQCGYNVRIQRNKTILDIINLVLGFPALYNISLKDQRLAHLAHETKLQDLITSEEKSLELNYQRNYYQIFVRIMEGPIKTITLDVSASESILSVKLKIQAKVGFPKKYQILRYARKQLEDHRAVQDYNIYEFSTLGFSLNLRDCAPNMRFADIAKAERAEDLKWSSSGPEWRRVRKPGLCLEGKCTMLGRKMHK